MFLRSFLFCCLLVMHSLCFTQQPKLILPVGHKAPVNSSQFSPDGKKLLSVSYDGTAKLWDVRSGNLLVDFKAGGDASRADITSAEFTKNGKVIIINYESYTKIFDADSGSEISLGDWLRDEPSIINQFRSDSKRAVLLNMYTGEFSTDSAAAVFELGTGKIVTQIKDAKQDIYWASYSPDGKKIITVSSNHSIQIRNAETGKTLIRISTVMAPVKSIICSPDSKKILVATDEHRRLIFDISSGKQVSILSAYKKEPQNDSEMERSFVQFSPDGKRVIEISGYNYYDDIPIMKYRNTTADLWNTETGKLIFTTTGLSEKDRPSFFSIDGKKILLLYADNTVKIRDAINGKIILSLNGSKDSLTCASFNQDNKRIITGSADGAVKQWDAVTGKFILAMRGHGKWISGIDCSTDGKMIASASGDNTIKIWNTNTGEIISDLTGHTNDIEDAWYSSDGKKIFISFKSEYRILDMENGSFLPLAKISEDTFFKPDNGTSLISPDGSVQLNWGADVVNIFNLNESGGTDGFRLDEILKSVKFSPDSKQVMFVSRDNSIKLYDLKSRRFSNTIYLVNSSDYFIQDSSGYYLCTTPAAKLLHYVTDRLNVISFEQLDVKFNRPDKVLESFGSRDTVLITTYRNAWNKRINKLGVDTTSFRDGFSVPEADFVNRDKIALDQTNESLVLHIKGIDSTYKLDRFNIWINEVPVFGQRSSSVRQDNSNSIDKTITVKLSQGENRIETSVTDVNGTESYRMPLIVNYNPPIKQNEKTYFIGIGIDKFADSKYNLSYSTKDIQDLTLKLKAKFGNNIIIDTLFNEQVTASNIKALKQKLLQTNVNDKVIISYSGHGLLSKDYDYYLSTYSVNFEKPEENGLAYDELESLLDSIPARKKLMLIDACHSGEVDKETFQQVQVNQAAMDSNHIVSKGVKIINTDTTSKKLGLLNSFELMQNLFVNVGKSTGATIISAASGTEFALENGSLKNGVFTFSVMEAMDKYSIMKISELKKIVGARVEQLTNGMQKPTSRNEAIVVDWNIW